MPISPNYAEDGTWLPKSSYFRWVMTRARSRTMVQQEPSAFRAQLAFCTSCGAAYLYSEGVRYDGDEPAVDDNDPATIGSRSRPHSPCHGTGPELVYDLEGLFEAVNILADHLRVEAGASPEVVSQEPPTPTRSERRRVSTADDVATSPAESEAPPTDSPPAEEPSAEPVSAAAES